MGLWPTWFMWNSCQVWVDDDSDGANVSSGDCVTQGTRNTQLNLQQKMVVSELGASSATSIAVS